MSSGTSAQPKAPEWGQAVPIPDPNARYIIQLSLALLLGAMILSRALVSSKQSKFPVINPAMIYDVSNWGWRARFVYEAEALLEKGRSQYKEKIFKINTNLGVTTVLPSSMANSIRNSSDLSFMKSVEEDFHARIPGFEAFAAATRSDELVQTIARKQLTQLLNKVTEPLSQETSYATELHFGKSTEWQRYTIVPVIQDIVARISSRVFLGPDVCRNEEWLGITQSYTHEAFAAAYSLRGYPPWIRDIVHHFHPGCKAVRAKAARAKEIITPVIEERRQAHEEALAQGENVTEFNDALQWLEDESGGASYNAASAQLLLSMASIHTSSDLFTETLLRLARRPDLVDELRQEIIKVLSTEGWKKTSLYNMKLLDSVMKETQRLRPIAMVSMARKATEDVKLPNGEVIQKGSRSVCLNQHRDAAVYADPDTFDARRFERLRGTDLDNIAHLVSTGPASMGFGHGRHACPGRFFAANQIKVALCHLLVKYDWKVGPEETPEPVPFKHSFNLMINPTTEVYARRRATTEFDIDDIQTFLYAE